MGLSVLAMVRLIRCFITTKKPNLNSKAGIRLAYLFVALVGTVSVAIPTVAMFVGFMPELNEYSVFETMFGIGIALLLIGIFIDRRLLKLP